MESHFSSTVNAGVAKLEKEGFKSRAWAAPFPFQVSTFVKDVDAENKEFAIVIWPYSDEEVAPVTEDMGEYGIPDGLEVDEPLFIKVNQGGRVKRQNFSSVYEYVHGVPNPDTLPPVERPSLPQRLQDAFHRAAWPVVSGTITKSEISGPRRSHLDITLDSGAVVKCSR